MTLSSFGVVVEWLADGLTMNIPRFELDRGMKDRGNELLSTAESLDGSLGLSYRCVTLQVSANPCAYMAFLHERYTPCATMEVVFTGAYPM